MFLCISADWAEVNTPEGQTLIFPTKTHQTNHGAQQSDNSSENSNYSQLIFMTQVGGAR